MDKINSIQQSLFATKPNDSDFLEYYVKSDGLLSKQLRLMTADGFNVQYSDLQSYYSKNNHNNYLAPLDSILKDSILEVLCTTDLKLKLDAIKTILSNYELINKLGEVGSDNSDNIKPIVQWRNTQMKTTVAKV